MPEARKAVMDHPPGIGFSLTEPLVKVMEVVFDLGRRGRNVLTVRRAEMARTWRAEWKIGTVISSMGKVGRLSPAVKIRWSRWDFWRVWFRWFDTEVRSDFRLFSTSSWELRSQVNPVMASELTDGFDDRRVEREELSFDTLDEEIITLAPDSTRAAAAAKPTPLVPVFVFVREMDIHLKSE